MPLVTITEAAKLINKSTQTIYRHVKSGKVSRLSDGSFDTAELIRVYGALLDVVSTSDATCSSDMLGGENTSIVTDTSQSEHVKWLESQIVQLQDDMTLLRNEGLAREQQSIDREARLMALLENKAHDRNNHQEQSGGLFGKFFK